MKLLERANAYCRQMDWKDMALLKVCLFALGTVAGMAIPRERRRAALLGGIFGICGHLGAANGEIPAGMDPGRRREPEREWYLEYED